MSRLRVWLWLLIGGAVIALLAWQGRHVAHLIPQAEAAVAALGAWGPIVFMGAVIVLCPLLFPDSLLGAMAGFVFGPGAGSVYYFVAIYVANLAIFALGRSWLRGPVLRLAEGRPRAQAILDGARGDSLRLTVLVRLVPVNVAFVSYVLGAGHFPWKSILIGNLALAPHLFLSVYIGHAARQATTLSTRTGSSALLEDAAVLLGLVATAAVATFVARMASRAIERIEEREGPEARAD